MQYMYKCEKCGKVFDSYDECEKHEKSHQPIDLYEWDDDLNTHTARWSESDILPYEIVLKNKGDAENGNTQFGLYRLDRMLTCEEISEINAARKERIRKRDEWIEKWNEEKRQKELEDAKAAYNDSSRSDDSVTGC
ncbi:MAG: hypothetical protein IKH75_01305 [Ruminococcus sp.]|nr:hypothetical protein [Ruminococcus sp.]